MASKRPSHHRHLFLHRAKGMQQRAEQQPAWRPMIGTPRPLPTQGNRAYSRSRMVWLQALWNTCILRCFTPVIPRTAAFGLRVTQGISIAAFVLSRRQ